MKCIFFCKLLVKGGPAYLTGFGKYNKKLILHILFGMMEPGTSATSASEEADEGLPPDDSVPELLAPRACGCVLRFFHHEVEIKFRNLKNVIESFWHVHTDHRFQNI